MKKLIFTGTISIIVIASLGVLMIQNPFQSVIVQKRGSERSLHHKIPTGMTLPYLAARRFLMLRDPASGLIPADIRSKELQFVAGLPAMDAGKNQAWTWRGPNNIGGRMLCVAVDLEDENHLLAGSASGGMWQSFDAGANWQKATAPDAEQSATCLVQDKRKGKHNIWYYGSGEMLSTTDRNISTNARTIGIGNGIFKSTDNGNTWTHLPSTQGGSPGVLNDVFQGIWRIVTDPVSSIQDVVYAACYGAILRSEDGGNTWQMVLGDLANKSFCTDIAITSEGTLYAALSSFSWSVEPPMKAGIWRSTNGLQWEKITPDGFSTDNRVTRLAIAPSNEEVMYVFTESQSPELYPFNGYPNSINTFWKMTWNTLADSAIWENRTAGIPGAGEGSINYFPYSFVVYGGYAFAMGVKPDNENIVFIGGMNLYRSENGFADSLQTQFIGGYPFDMDSLHALHPDMHGITFMHSNPNVMMISNDGGIYITHNCLADSSSMSWERLNNKLTTTQFYSVAIDHGSSGNDWILGGLQDNNWYYTVTDDLSAFWFDIDICFDGFATCVASNWQYCVISAYSGNIWTSQFDETMHTKNIFPQLPDTLLKYYDPVMGSNSLFPFYQNFVLDPTDYETFYLPTITSIWRKDNLKAAAFDTSLRNAGWNHLSHVDIGDASEISCINVSKNPAHRLFYGTSLGRVYRIDNANVGNPIPADITGSNFPANAFVAWIDIDENNADHLLVVFSNYNVQSMFFSSDGGSSWTAVGGNLEENIDGTGAGPSVRCAKQLTYNGHRIIFAGTSAGLYSTRILNGDSTIWVKEGTTSIGNVIVDMIDARQHDGFIAIGTHGNGVYSTFFEPSAGWQDPSGISHLKINNVFPNPARQELNISYSISDPEVLEINILDANGVFIKTLDRDDKPAGKHTSHFSLVNVTTGLYFIEIKSSKYKATRKVMVIN
ncbi:MAG: T9SS type A sorting domain-containing protein [Bacteroidetes bacterium]|nr:T9SS type A sorting domain-containing protein [Bacteroidota bacterium]